MKNAKNKEVDEFPRQVLEVVRSLLEVVPTAK
jgi:hypothetical protein